MKHYILLLIIILISSFAFSGTLTTTKELDRNTILKPIKDLEPSTDNIKTYEPLIEKITIKESDNTPIATVKLLTPKNFKVGIGYQLVAEFEVTSQQAYLDFLNQMYFYNIKANNNPITRSFDLKEKVTYLTSVPTYETTCSSAGDKNSQEVCSITQKGSKLIQKTRYDLYSGKDFPIGETKTLSIWTNTTQGESIEWIPEMFGVVVEEWATWDASLNTNLAGYWKLDDTNTSTLDSLNLLNGTNTGVDVQATPFLYGKSYYFNAGTDRAIDLNGSFTPTTNFSINVWIKTATSSGNRVMAQFNAVDAGKGWLLDCGGTSNAPRFGVGTGSLTFATGTNADHNCDSNQWRMITGTYDGNSIKLYVDGVFAKDNAAPSPVIYNSSTHLTLGGFYNAGAYAQSITGLIDEASVWNRVITPTEITSLFGSGAGMTYTVNPQARVTFNVYRKGTATNLNTIGFDANVNALDLTNQTSPFNTIYYDQNTNVSAIFSRAGYDSNMIAFVMDSNKTMTVYLTDSTAPTVGNTLSTGYNISGSYISGTGIISATISDAGSDINSAGCYYSINNGDNWGAADKNSTHCYKSQAISTNGTYRFRFKVIDNAGNETINTASILYTADLTAPTTYLDYNFPAGDTNALISLICVDTNVACSSTTYRINSGAWNNYTIPFYAVINSFDRIDYNSTDVLGNIEAINTSLIPAFVSVTDSANTRIILYGANDYNGYDVTSWAWMIDGNAVTGTSDQNIYYYTSPNLDLNVCLTTNGVDTFYNSVLTWDTIQPTLVADINASPYGFNSNFDVNFSLTCYDNFPTVDYNIVWINNGIETVLYSGTDLNGTVIDYNLDLNAGQSAQLRLTCSDESNTTTYLSGTYYALVFRLVNEETGVPLTPTEIGTDFNIVRVYTLDGNYSFNFKDTNAVVINFFSPDDDLWFEFGYKDVAGTKLNRQINFAYTDDSNVAICVPDYQTLYQQRFVANSSKTIVLKNNVANCYVIAGNLNYAYDTGYSVTTYTVPLPYYLYTYIDGVKSYLALIDGGVPTAYNIDALIFSRSGFNINIGTDTVSFAPLINSVTGIYDTNIVQIYYKAYSETNVKTEFEVLNGTTSIWTYTEYAEPNEILVFFYWGGLDVNTDDVLTLNITKTNSAGEETTTSYYFTTYGTAYQNTVSNGWAAIIAVLFFLFGITLVAYNKALGFFGIVIGIVALFLVNLASGAWWVSLLSAAFIIIIAYIFLLTKQGGVKVA